MSEVRRSRLSPPRKRQSYHHADLRRALLDAALVHLRNGDVTSLSVLKLARAVGVSPGAPYHHFADKLDVLASLAEEGFALWLDEVERVVSRAQDARTALATLARAWLTFAVRHPEHYRIMFLPDLGDRRRFASLHATSGRGLELLVDLVAGVYPRARPEELLERAVAFWSTVHGFAALRTAGVLTNIPGLPPLQALEERLVEHFLAAIDVA
jgi:AcrR family transcriptional regulator